MEALSLQGAFDHAVALSRAGNVAEAQPLYEAIVAAQPLHAGALCNLGGILSNQRKYESALAHLRIAVQLAPENHEFRNNIGNLLWRMQRLDEARQQLAEARRLNPASFGPWHNSGLLEYSLGHLHEAVKCYDKALVLQPGHPSVLSDRAMAILASGRPDAWEANEARWGTNLARHPVWSTGIPQWQGEDLAGKTILVHHEQGLGDSLQFCRFIPYLVGRAARVVFSVQTPLQRLMKMSLQGVDVIGEKEVPEDAHFFVPLMSLPRWLQVDPTQIPPWLFKSPLAPRVIPESDRLHVGITWAGSPGFESDYHRSMPFHHMLTLGDARIHLHSLQVGPRRQDLFDSSASALVRDLSPFMTDFAASAALIRQLDVVVAVDTSTLHIAAGSGVPVLAVLPHLRCWRWLRNRVDSPWYPSLRIVQQKSPGDWAGVMQQVKKILSVQPKRLAAAV